MPSPPDSIHIGGLVPFSTVDFPGHLCAVIFCQGCPWRCRYCHNPHLQPFTPGSTPWRDVVAFLDQRRGLLDAVVFSGGEPTAQRGIESAMRTVRRMGFRIALHTAGIFPRRLRRILPLVDWVGLDIKAPFDPRYDTLSGRGGSHASVQSSLRHVLKSGVDYELRTTLHPALLDDIARRDLERDVHQAGARPIRWQDFRAAGCTDPELVSTAK